MTPEKWKQLLRLTIQQHSNYTQKQYPNSKPRLTNFGLLREDRALARDVGCDRVNYNNSAMYTQSSGALPSAVPGAPPVIFIANNAPHEYVSQGNAHWNVGWSRLSRLAARISGAAEGGRR